MAAHTFSNRKYKSIFLSWWLIWAALQVYVLNGYNLQMEEVITDSLVTNMLIVAACALVNNNMRFYLPKSERYWYVFVISLWLGAMATGLSGFILKVIFNTDEHYKALLSASWIIRFSIAFLLIVCCSVISLLWYALAEQTETDKRKADAEKILRDAELVNLRQQLQPHFLFNSLNSISSLTIINTEEARRMVQQLSDFLRGTLKRDEKQWLTLSEELEHLQLYLEIEKVRFGTRLKTAINCNEDACKKTLPALLLQPIVENAIKFGLYDTIDDVTITIDAVAEDNYLQVIITNPYDAETAQPMQGTGFGLQSIKRRLYLLFARQDLLQTKNENNTFTTTLTIPQIVMQK